MKINAISSTNFKGLFVDKSSENNGDWKMVYKPYSWELKRYEYSSEYKNQADMYYQEDVDLTKDYLPDNEIIIYDNSRYQNSYKREGVVTNKDILGTTFYEADYNRNTLKQDIIQGEAMNREESLTVLNKKFAKFIDMKKELMASKTDLSEPKKNLSYDHDFYTYNDDIKKHLFQRDYTLDYSARKMDGAFCTIKNTGNRLLQQFAEYINLFNSLEGVRERVEQNKEEIRILKEARESGNLIDISRRDVKDPNGILWKAMHNVDAIKDKIIALPHKTISVKALLEKVDSSLRGSALADNAIRVVDNLIAHRL